MHTNLLEASNTVASTLTISYTRHLCVVFSLLSARSSSLDRPRFWRVSVNSSSSRLESKRPLMCPLQLIGQPCLSLLNTLPKILAYSAIHSSKSISRRPSKIAMSLREVRRCEAFWWAGANYPPVLVPPMRSKTWHGFTAARPVSARLSFTIVINPLSILNDESPRTPPPSMHVTVSERAECVMPYQPKDSKHSPSSLSGRPRASINACWVSMRALGNVLNTQANSHSVDNEVAAVYYFNRKTGWRGWELMWALSLVSPTSRGDH